MPNPVLVVFTAVWLTLAGAPAAGSMGALEPYISADEGGAWQVALDQNSLQLRNGDAQGDITYYYLNSPQSSLGNRTISVDLRVPYATSNSMAGILYGFETNPKTYFLFTVAGDRTVNLLYRGPNGLENQLKTSIDIGPKSVTRLRLVEAGKQISLFANDKEVGQLQNSRLGRGAVGVAAANIGTYTFSNFEVTDRVATTKPAVAQTTGAPTRSRTSLTTTMQDYVDPKMGMVQRRVPLPAGWVLDNNPNDAVLFSGPNNLVAYYTDSGRFVDSNDPAMLQSARMGGSKTAPVTPVSSYLQQYYAPGMAQRGFQLTNSFPMPRVQEFWELFGAGMPQGLSQKSYEATGAEWQHKDGSRAFTILVLNVLRRPDATLWNVGANEIHSPQRSYKFAKQVLTNATINTELNPNWQITMNQQLLRQLRTISREGATRARRAQAAHLNRMNAILERGKTSRQIAKINSDIIDSSHSSYLSRTNMVAKSTERFNDMIAERSVIGNQDTGELYKVDAGANFHWVSSDGIHLPTDNALYDPRTDPSMNSWDWAQFELVR